MANGSNDAPNARLGILRWVRVVVDGRFARVPLAMPMLTTLLQVRVRPSHQGVHGGRGVRSRRGGNRSASASGHSRRFHLVYRDVDLHLNEKKQNEGHPVTPKPRRNSSNVWKAIFVSSVVFFCKKHAPGSSRRGHVLLPRRCLNIRPHLNYNTTNCAHSSDGMRLW